MPEFQDVVTALSHSHDRLRSLVEPLSPSEVAGPSYASEWSIAQVVSHLASQAEVFTLFLDAGLKGEEPPGRDAFPAIWAVWDAKSPADQAADGLRADGDYLARLEALSTEEVEQFQVTLFGFLEADAPTLARMRLAEHIVHTWDVAVALDPTATLAADGVDQLVGTLGQMAARTGKPTEQPLRLHIRTTSPTRDLVLTTGEGVELVDAQGDSDIGSHLELPAEAFVRLVYGRLDADHTPAGLTSSIDLADLRAVFPGV
jgi:uncharacterized protein (TIGR03083 family)